MWGGGGDGEGMWGGGGDGEGHALVVGSEEGEGVGVFPWGVVLGSSVGEVGSAGGSAAVLVAAVVVKERPEEKTWTGLALRAS